MFFKNKKPIIPTPKIIYDQKAVCIYNETIYNGYVLELSDDLIIVRCDDGFDRYVTNFNLWHFLTREGRPELADERFKEYALYKRVKRLGKENVMETYKEEKILKEEEQ